MNRWHAVAKQVAYWTMPPGIQALLRSVLGYDSHKRLTHEERTILERNRELHNLHTGERCFILATGPSIKKQDLTLLEGELCISVSNFFVHPDFDLIRPRYQCIAPLHSPFTDEDGVRWFRQMESKMAHTILFLGYSDKRLIDEYGLFIDRQIYYLQLRDSWANLGNIDFDLTRPLPSCQSVSIMALMVALYIGCREIYLLGTDHTEFNLNTGQYDYRHFYDGKGAKALGEEPAPPDLEVTFSCCAKLWQQYKILRKYAHSRGIAIYNATRGGILDLFPRVEYELLFERCRD